MKTKKEVLRLENVSKIYNVGEVEIKALDSINFSICEGDFVSIMAHLVQEKQLFLMF